MHIISIFEWFIMEVIFSMIISIMNNFALKLYHNYQNSSKMTQNRVTFHKKIFAFRNNEICIIIVDYMSNDNCPLNIVPNTNHSLDRSREQNKNL